ncbi:hypothetical protein D8674_021850 [Pyrus ussuriensis x Pyrus communis]|uniref:Uncharacterized protein n=1 Tax=Pyrus ussuriensis x Pyrus communis TaxID=2448454 RepID=A0A5N5GNQ4_9ROSA|nr:hypothetical protein D8674_021850 [Pyrus ussuriensis x Pyrus communis]
MQYKEEKIIKDVTQPNGRVIKVDKVILGLNGLFVKVLFKVDLRFPLKHVLIVNHEEDYPILISYEIIFEDVCPEVEADDGYFMIDTVFEDEPFVYPEDVIMDVDVKAHLQKYVMLCFPNATTVEEEFTNYEESRPDRLYKEVVASVKPKWVAKADLVLVVARLAAEATSTSARPTVGMLSVREENANEVRPSAYLDELD